MMDPLFDNNNNNHANSAITTEQQQHYSGDHHNNNVSLLEHQQEGSSSSVPPLLQSSLSAAGAAAAAGQIFVPSDAELTLLCLDHLRSILRKSRNQHTNNGSGSSNTDLLPAAAVGSCLDADYLTVACWALNKSFAAAGTGTTASSSESLSLWNNNDAFFDATTAAQHPAAAVLPHRNNSNDNATRHRRTTVVVPSLEEMEQELLVLVDHTTTNSNNNGNNTFEADRDEKKASDSYNNYFNNNNNYASTTTTMWTSSEELYPYDDGHASNAHRFYLGGGLGQHVPPPPTNPHPHSGIGISGTSELLGSGSFGSPNILLLPHHPLQLGEVVTAGLLALQARSRLAAEQDLIRTPLFEQYIAAVQTKGFFNNTSNTSATTTTTSGAAAASHHTSNHGEPLPPPELEHGNYNEALYEERFRKVVAKFRHKLCAKSGSSTSSDGVQAFVAPTAGASSGFDCFAAAAAAYRQQQRNTSAQEQRRESGVVVVADHHHVDDEQQTVYIAELPIPAAYVRKTNSTSQQQQQHLFAQNHQSLSQLPSLSAVNSRMLEPSDSTISAMSSSQYPRHHPADLKEAEKLKNAGNAHMQRKEYQQAADCYTAALGLSPSGPNSHVYFSNRAAAAVSLKQFQRAVVDSERSLALKPDYGKAHARLGLAHFLTGNYRAAVSAYTVALKYEPDNQSSRNYLEKSVKRLTETASAPATVPPVVAPTAAATTTAGGDPTVTKSQQQASAVYNTSSNNNYSVGSELRKTDSTTSAVGAVGEEAEAEKYKVKGNSLMAHRDYQAALDAYSKAIQLNPAGPLSHVYYSNRAAALCYLERYADAERDSVASLQLYPTYGKAHARLGLSRFFLHDYAGAVHAYQTALEYDPDNAASKSYLAKAQAKLAAASGIV